MPARSTNVYTQSLVASLIANHGYDEALRRGRKMSEIVREKFTWENAARRFMEIVKEVT